MRALFRPSGKKITLITKIGCKLTRLGVRFPATFKLQALISRAAFFSKAHSQYQQANTTPQQGDHTCRPPGIGRLEAFVGCEFQTHSDPQREKMYAVQAVAAAAKTIYKKRLGRSLSQKFIYVNTREGAVLAGMQVSIKEAIDKVKAADLRLAKLETEAKAAKLRSSELEIEAKAAKSRSSELEMEAKAAKSRASELEIRQKKTEEWIATMQPLEQTAINIRKRFFAYHQRPISRKLSFTDPAIKKGNQAAHEGNIRTDRTLISRGDITDLVTFYQLYGIEYEDAEPYLSMLITLSLSFLA